MYLRSVPDVDINRIVFFCSAYRCQELKMLVTKDRYNRDLGPTESSIST